MTRIEKFPRTPHLAWLGQDKPRSDKVMDKSERALFLEHPIVVEEKIDGANLGLFVSETGKLKAQNRGTILESGKTHPQFEPFWNWLGKRMNTITQHLGRRYVIFGEWCYAVHSVYYSDLPDWYLGFDVLDMEKKGFLDSEFRNRLLGTMGIESVPRIARSCYTLDQLIVMLEDISSKVGARQPEGLYLRVENQGLTTRRAKLVRPEFHAGISEHWAKKALVRNRLTYWSQRPGLTREFAS